DDTVASAGADVQGRGAQQRTGAGAEGDSHAHVGGEADGGIVAELVAAAQDRLDGQQRAVSPVGRLSGEGQLAGGPWTDRDGGGGRVGQGAAAEGNRDVAGNVVRQVGEGNQAVDCCPAGGALQRAAAGAARRRHHRGAV